MIDVDGTPTVGFDQARFREVLGHFASGVTVITTLDDRGPSGFTCQSFMSVSLDPPLVALSPSKASDTWPRLREAGFACVNVLSEDHEDVARNFAGKGDGKFDGVGYRKGMNGAPVLDGAIAWVEGSVEGVHEAGDHYLVVLRASEIGSTKGAPLIFYRGGFGGFRP